jgi:hypothetical protein
MGLPVSDLGLGYNLALTEDWRHRVHAPAS